MPKRGSQTFNWVLVYLLLLLILFLVVFHQDCSKFPNGSAVPATAATKSADEDRVSIPISEIMSGKPIQLEQDDEHIIKYIWDNNILEPASNLDYKLSQPKRNPSGGQAQFIQKYFKDMKNGYFVEAGALDGEHLSNTLFLEKNLDWRGLLVEGDPINYAKLLKKQRKAWTAKACLSIKPYPHQAEFMQSFSIGKIVESKAGIKKSVVTVQCVPLFSLLAALNVTTVDYFSLDVEGLELEILKTIPFHNVYIKTLSVEFLPTNDKEGKNSLIGFMESKGYNMVEEIRKPRGQANDFIFVHKDFNKIPE